MYELETVAVEVGDVGGVVAGGEVGTIRRSSLIDAAGLDCGCVGSVDEFVRIADDPQVKPGLAWLTLRSQMLDPTPSPLPYTSSPMP
ncbi:hypothetical protein DID99_24455 [Burkholderia sp. Bp8986]|nr:hypothetical protein DIE01_06840 [Burkholderia sp. Bp8990]RQS50732.1 hypothetical protein DID99_24455 [Burkholderia sp. Bp8986]RQZ48582.1 hypothetical protein DIE17_10840 [Burkholderia sp. Bp9099]